MPLMGSIYVGTSGLQTSQNSLNTTAHNLSNMGTTGYVRQQVLHGDRLYNTIKNGSAKVSTQQVGLGVNYSKVRQVRDYFLDQSYRRENGRSSFYATSFEALREVEDLLDELNDDASFNQSLTNLWKSIEELSKTPDDTVVQRLLVQNANSFLTNAQQVYQGLVDYQTEVNAHIKENVDKINELGHRILDLNNKIRNIEVGGIESANDFRDARNQALDELSGLVSISYGEDIYGSVRVKVEGVDFVVADTVNEIGMVADDSTGYYTPYWKINSKVYKNEHGVEKLDISNAKVFDTYALISAEKNTDIGKLRAMLYIRGDKVADFTDIPIKPVTPDATDLVKYPYGNADPQYEADVEQYNKDMDEYEKKVDYYNHTIAQSVCMNIQAEFDQLIHNVAIAVNGILYDAYKESGGTYMCEDNGSPLELFQRVECDGYRYNGTSWEPVAEITDDDYYNDTLYSIPNLQINPLLIREAGRLKFRHEDGTVDYETASKFVEAFDADIYSLNPNVTTTCSINTYYTNLVSQVANSGAVYKNISLSQQTTVDSISHSREQVLGVSSDEELTGMIKFQNAFNAASRYINVVDEMLEHIITQLG
ncbi:MAG: flagellar hook-associated protein FlgK [Lachnospiraceae bacterium]|nr:flagellar hook-associated protein FlgK [Lachnospiraceae bacterium]